MQCPVAKEFGRRHLALDGWRAGDGATAHIICTIAAGGPGGIRLAMWLDAVLTAADSCRHAEAHTAPGVMAARLKEVVRRHPRCRAALPPRAG